MNEKTTRPRIPDDACRGAACCTWLTFRDGFEPAYQERFGLPPTIQAWRSAVRDWRAGSTGWEAAQIARRRARQPALDDAAEPRTVHAA